MNEIGEVGADAVMRINTEKETGSPNLTEENKMLEVSLNELRLELEELDTAYFEPQPNRTGMIPPTTDLQ